APTETEPLAPATATQPQRQFTGLAFETTISPWQRMISACAGAVMTSLITTPLDLIKTRLQAQVDTTSVPHPVAHVQRFNPTTLSTTTCTVEVCFCTVPNRRTLTCYYQRPLNLFTSSLDYPNHTGQGPFDLRRRVPSTLPATARHTIPYHRHRPITGTLDGLMQIGRHEGLTSLWRGLSPTLVMSVPTTVIYFVGYDLLRDKIGQRFHDQPNLDVYSPFVAGATARALSATVISPLELVRTRMQSSASHNLPVVLRGVATMVQSLGVWSLWRGLAPTLWRDVPFSAIYWTSYEAVKKSLAHYCVTSTGSHSLSATDNFRLSFLSGALSGMLAATLTIPFDVAKTRRQIDLAHGPIDHTLENTFPLMRRIVRQEGFAGLYRGLSARLFKVAPACAIMISSYEMGKKFFAVENTEYVNAP
ncbi:Carrier protein, mitochondrial, partial [Dimargaris xerosporica]